MSICRRKSSKWQIYGVWCRSHPWSGFGGFGKALWNLMWMLCDHVLLRFGRVSHQVPSCSTKLQPGVGKGEEGLNFGQATSVSHDTCRDNTIARCGGARLQEQEASWWRFVCFGTNFLEGDVWLKWWHFSITCISVNCGEHLVKGVLWKLSLVRFYEFQG